MTKIKIETILYIYSINNQVIIISNKYEFYLLLDFNYFY